MLTRIAYFIPDRFVLLLLATIAFASVLPVQGVYADYATTLSSCAIFLLFFLHGLRLPAAEVATAIRHWRLQVAIWLFVFAAMPLAAMLIVFLGGYMLPSGLLIGLLFVGLLPSTVQSAISYAALAGGNVAASVMAAALTNLSAIIMLPVLVLLVIGPLSAGGAVGSNATGDDGDGGMGWAVTIKIITILLLPFILGQLSSRWLSNWAIRQKTLLALMDRSAIAIAVYVAFSAAVTGGIWATLSGADLWLLAALVMVLLGFGFGGAWMLGRICRFDAADRISLLFAGAHKSIATGAPMAAILFAGSGGGPDAGMVILPAIIYHQLQLILSAPLANRLRARLDLQKSTLSRS